MTNRPGTSLQDILRRRQREGFVGREGHIAQFRENLALPNDDSRRRFLFNVHGDAVRSSLRCGRPARRRARRGPGGPETTPRRATGAAVLLGVADQDQP